MKLALWKRTALAGLVALTVTGASVTTFSAGHASAEQMCVKPGAGMRPICEEV